MQKTALYDQHLHAGAKMVDFHGWQLPIHYGSQIKEHEAVRSRAGVFDVSHMTLVDVVGEDAQQYLQYLLANNIGKLQQLGKALYTAMLDTQGGILDDLIVYKMEQGCRLVVNCATREQDLDWMHQQLKGLSVSIKERDDMAMLAVQGPEARTLVSQVLPRAAALIDRLTLFEGQPFGQLFIARTGYTGEDGLEILLPNDEVAVFWDKLLEVGIQPCGLGARDTLRLEAGLNLYGNDMNTHTSPWVSNMAWTVALEPNERDFIGKAALLEEKTKGVNQQLVGLVIDQKAIMRQGQKVFLDNEVVGEITSGGFSPTLKQSIAMARIQNQEVDQVSVEIRGKRLDAQVIKLPFIRRGKPTF